MNQCALGKQGEKKKHISKYFIISGAVLLSSLWAERTDLELKMRERCIREKLHLFSINTNSSARKMTPSWRTAAVVSLDLQQLKCFHKSLITLCLNI